ncbi:MAG: UDP-N-acetylglucosamine 2-epimerase (non-hydrolyzing) [Pseudomonadota bacterium]|uniref:non-hydrolyzing UDP-N-acetylglucosamine 2-epimerase n=1 Tax=Roseixanthobacter finlandensis TaxID=3119922 RepID=UPI003727637F
MRILSVFGTRPEAIKMAPLVSAIAAEPSLTSLVCVTGQHRAMLDQVLGLFRITPDYDLDVMRPDQTLNALCARVIAALDPVLDEARPDRVLVHGDTTTALAAALAAFNRGIKVGHVEAGLRTYDLARPWPEEMNRQVVDRLCDQLFAPTAAAAANLASEHVQGHVTVTGNTGIDALFLTLARIDSDAALHQELDARFADLDPARRLILVTGHRRENFGAGFVAICDALARLARRGDVDIVYPVHLNPNVRGPVMERLGDCPNMHLIAPLDYVPFLYLMRRAALVLTDSGGVQEEAPSLGKPVLVMRDVTERPEAVIAGTVELVGTDPARIVSAVARLLDDPAHYARFAQRLNPYGDGKASGRIVDTLCARGTSTFAA